MAIAFDETMDDAESIKSLKAVIAIAVASDSAPEDRGLLEQLGLPGQLNAWCGLCGARWDTWCYEVSPVAENDWDVAVGSLRQCERGGRQTAEILKAAGLAYDARELRN
jgi:hypothetical protein